MTIKNSLNESTARALFALASEMAQLSESAERVRIQFEALAGQHGIALPCTPASSL